MFRQFSFLIRWQSWSALDLNFWVLHLFVENVYMQYVYHVLLHFGCQAKQQIMRGIVIMMSCRDEQPTITIKDPSLAMLNAG